MQEQLLNKLLFWDLGDDLGSKSFPKWAPTSIQIGTKTVMCDSWEKSMFFWTNVFFHTEPKWRQNEAQIEPTFSKNRSQKNKWTFNYFSRTFLDDFWSLSSKQRKSKNHWKPLFLLCILEVRASRKSWKSSNKLNRKSYHPKVTTSHVFGLKKSDF